MEVACREMGLDLLDDKRKIPRGVRENWLDIHPIACMSSFQCEWVISLTGQLHSQEVWDASLLSFVNSQRM